MPSCSDVGARAQSDGPQMRSGTWFAFEGEERAATLGIVELRHRRRVMPHRCGVRDELRTVEPQRCPVAYKEVPLKQVFRDADAVSLRIAGYDEQNVRCSVFAVDEPGAPW